MIIPGIKQSVVARLSAITGGMTPSEIGEAVSLSPTDLRSIKNWFKNNLTNNSSVIWWGDSTTEQMAGINLVSYTGEILSTAAKIEPELTGNILMYNYGANGRTIELCSQSGEDINAGGLNIRVNGVSEFLTTKANPLVIFCFGINDCRADANIASSSYGDAAQLSKVSELRGYFSDAVEYIRSENSECSIVFRMPNVTAPTSTYLENGVTGQNMADVLQIAYRGDDSLGIDPIDSIYQDSILFDTQAILTGYEAYQNDLIHSDGLHPSIDGYNRMMKIMLRLIFSNKRTGLKSIEDAKKKKNDGIAISHSVSRPASVDVFYSNEWVPVATISAVRVNASYLDVSFPDGNEDAAWGGLTGSAYGSSFCPGFGFSDIMVWGNGLIMPVNNMSDSNNGSYHRWFSGGPDGYYPTTEQLPVGTTGILYRNKFSGCDQVRQQQIDSESIGLNRITAKSKAYRFFIQASSNGSVTIIGAGGDPFVLSDHTITTSDSIVICGVTDNAEFNDGLSLSSATITALSKPGEYTIALSGVDFTRATIRQGFILS